ncbi:MAG: 4Fe-4S dicluster domain-containing protein [Anaerolineales bacterium]|nr:4Fe-4S dicluster domain-containing protein [Anaerolineales bacterium]
MAKYGFLIDASRCIDCRACLVACSVENNVPMKSTRIWIKDSGVTGEFPNLEHYTAPFHCMHCIDPSCVSACTVGALQKNEDGIITYDNEACIGCRYCMYACPFEVPHFEWDQQFALITKCDLCVSRLGDGEAEPACAATCPTDAIQFGKREDMLAMAHNRIKDESSRYVDHVFGEHENGGTSTFYISPVPFEQLGFPSTETMESPAHFNRIATEEGTPIIAVGAAIGMTGIYLAIEHNQKKNGTDKIEHVETKHDSAGKE